jgi:hypothetical protein
VLHLTWDALYFVFDELFGFIILTLLIFPFNFANQILVGVFLSILHRKRHISLLHNRDDPILCLSISLHLIFLGSSEHDSSLFMIIP